jgi:hypothetical protein
MRSKRDRKRNRRSGGRYWPNSQHEKKIEAAKKIPNVRNASVVISPIIGATNHIENSSNMSENTGNLATNNENSVTDNSVNSASNVDTNTTKILQRVILIRTRVRRMSAPPLVLSVCQHRWHCRDCQSSNFQNLEGKLLSGVKGLTLTSANYMMQRSKSY